jgi:hypothetical protein
MIKIRLDIHEMEAKIVQTSNETKRWVFEKVNKIDKPSRTRTRRRREKTLSNKSRDEKETIRTNTNEIQRIMREYFKNYI